MNNHIHSNEIDISDCIERFKIQTKILCDRPNRNDLFSHMASDKPRYIYNVNIWRNHAVESVLEISETYNKYAKIKLAFKVGGYDDSLAFAEWGPSDCELLWIDPNRYIQKLTINEYCGFLKNRVTFLRSKTSAPILLATWWPNETDSSKISYAFKDIPGVFVADFNVVFDMLADSNPFDFERSHLTGTPLGKDTQLLMARELALRWLPGIFSPPIKAVVVDLDNTLYEGVLGEDGAEGIVLTKDHFRLQSELKRLRSSGIFLALASKNVLEDVKRMFELRSDFPLQYSDFTSVAVSWAQKSDGISKIATDLRISTDAMIFVDDNPNELIEVLTKHSLIGIIYAGEGPGLTKIALEYFPGLWRWFTTADDVKRIRDLESHSYRNSLTQTVNCIEDFHHSLETKIEIWYDSKVSIQRLADLCIKTNQFNLTLNRTAITILEKAIDDSEQCLVGISLSDRLSDSGLIAMILVERIDQNKVVIKELCISCRALGRSLESVFVYAALLNMPLFKGCSIVEFQYKKGERNHPALNWLNEFAGCRAKDKFASVEVEFSSILPPVLIDHINTTIHYDK